MGDEYERMLAAKGFDCPAHKVRMLPAGCDAQLALPKDQRAGGCGPDCPVRGARGLCVSLAAGNETQAALPRTGETQAQPAPQSAWDRISAATGHSSHSALAKDLGCWQSQVSHIFRMVIGKGKRPKGDLWAKMVKLSGLTEEQILGLPESALTLMGAAPAEQLPTSDDLERLRSGMERVGAALLRDVAVAGEKIEAIGAALSKSPAPADSPTSSPPQPSGSVAPIPAAGPGGPAPRADALIDTEEAQQLLDSAESPGTMALGAASGSIASIVAGSIATEAEARKMEAGQGAAEGIPTDFVAYRGMPRGSKYSKPLISLRVDGDIELTAGTVRAFGWQGVKRVRLLWSAQRRQVGLLPTGEEGQGTYKLQVAKSDRRRVSSAFLRANGITERGMFRAEQGPGGMLVATIEKQAQQGEEAA